MTAITSQPPRPPLALLLAQRSLIRTVRQRRLLILPLIFPMLLFAINASALSSVTSLHGFPPVSYTAFGLAVPFLLGGMLAAVGAGTDFAHDLETGMLDRLRLTSLSTSQVLAGQLGGVVAFATLQATLFVIVGLAAGVSIAAGPLGGLALIVLSTLIALAFSSLGMLLAARTRTAVAVQGFFPLLFVTVFLSSAFLPRNVIAVGWFHTVATINPISYLVEGMRSLIITGWDGHALGLAIAIALAVTATALALAGRSLDQGRVTA